MIDVFIVDDHPVVANGLAKLLSDYPDIHISGIESDGKKAISRIIEEQPRVVLQDINLGDIRGPEVMEAVLAQQDKSRFIIFTVLPANTYALRLIKSGAAGFLNKNALIEEMVEAIRTVARGLTYLSLDLKRLQAEQGERNEKVGLDLLSKREYEIFLLLIEGKRQVDIEEELDIGHSTMTTYVSRIHRKLQTQSLGDLIRLGTQEGII
jgi:DNA-binding NarL/FixJ family response regulator